MKLKQLCISENIFVFPVIFAAAWQLLACAVSLMCVSFNTVICISCLSALTLTGIIYVNLPQSPGIKLQHVFIFTGIAIFSSVLFIFIFHLEIMDAIWPTSVIGLVGQVARGHFPVSFMSFPEFPANYHQGFIFLAGVLSRFTGIHAAYSVRGLNVAFFLYFIFLAQIVIRKNSGFSSAVFAVFLFFLMKSLPMNLSLFERYHADYARIGLAQYFQSNSWPLSFCIFLVIFFVITNFPSKNTSRLVFLCGLPVLTLSTTNACLFSVTAVCITILFVVRLFFRRNEENIFISSMSITFFVLCLWIFPKFLPSAFLAGKYYDSPHLMPLFLGSHPEVIMPWSVYFMRFVSLGGIISVFAIFVAIWLYKNRKLIFHENNMVIYFLSFVMGMSVLLPVFFSFTNINWWDNLHKFSLIWMLASWLTVSIAIPPLYYRSGKLFMILLIVLLLSVLLELPSVLNSIIPSLQYISGLGSFPDKEAYQEKGGSYEDVVNFLKSEKNIPLIYPYGHKLYQYSPALFIASFSGSFIRNCFYAGFLLSPKIKQDYANNMEWWQPEKFYLMVSDPHQPKWVLVENKDLNFLLRDIQAANGTYSGSKRNISILQIRRFKMVSLLKLSGGMEKV